MRHLVVMGVSGSGKSTVASRLAAALERPFVDADDLHTPENVARMRAGIPLTTADREPWLDRIRAWMDEQAARGTPGVVACSALRRAYRDRLRGADGGVAFLHLALDEQTALERVSGRSGHFMSADLVDSQFAALEPLGADEAGATLDGHAPPDAVLAEAIARATDPEVAGPA